MGREVAKSLGNASAGMACGRLRGHAVSDLAGFGDGIGVAGTGDGREGHRGMHKRNRRWSCPRKAEEAHLAREGPLPDAVGLVQERGAASMRAAIVTLRNPAKETGRANRDIPVQRASEACDDGVESRHFVSSHLRSC
jgi:hypothetical protein